MENLVEENYTEEGKQLFELIQEWIDENNSFLYCKTNIKELKSNYR